LELLPCFADLRSIEPVTKSPINPTDFDLHRADRQPEFADYFIVGLAEDQLIEDAPLPSSKFVHCQLTKMPPEAEGNRRRGVA
jgi:hypothetical protein